MDVWTMHVARAEGYSENRAPLYLPLQPVGKKAEREWYLCLDGDTLELQRPERVAALEVHRDEAARYVDFASDIRWGRTVSFEVVPGLRRYTFRCSYHVLTTLLSWLPNKSEPERRKEIRYAAVAVVLFGIPHILPEKSLSPLCATILIAAGLYSLVFPQRRSYLLNGLALLGTGLWDLFAPSLYPVDPRWITPEQRLVPVVIGSLLVLWGIQQLAMLQPNEELRAARAERDRRMALLPPESALVRRLGLLNAVAAVAFVFQTAVIPVAAVYGPAAIHTHDPAAFTAVLPRLVITASIAVITIAATVLFLAKKRPAYLEARASGQFLVAVAVLTTWSVATRLVLGESLLDPGLESETRMLTQPYAWACLIACILLFNRAFMREVDRELEEQRNA